MVDDEDILTKIRSAIKHLEDIAGIDRENWLIIHEISPYSDTDDTYKIIDIIKEEPMFVSDSLDELLWNIQQMY